MVCQFIPEFNMWVPVPFFQIVSRNFGSVLQIG